MISKRSYLQLHIRNIYQIIDNSINRQTSRRMNLKFFGSPEFCRVYILMGYFFPHLQEYFLKSVYLAAINTAVHIIPLPVMAGAPSRAKTPPRSTVPPPITRGTSPKTSLLLALPKGQRSSSPMRSGWPRRSPSTSIASAPKRPPRKRSSRRCPSSSTPVLARSSPTLVSPNLTSNTRTPAIMVASAVPISIFPGKG